MPINFDLIFVCRKKYGHAIKEIEMASLIQRSKEDTLLSLNKLHEDRVAVGIGDIKMILMGHYLARLSSVGNLGTEIDLIYQAEPVLDELAGIIHGQYFAANNQAI